MKLAQHRKIILLYLGLLCIGLACNLVGAPTPTPDLNFPTPQDIFTRPAPQDTPSPAQTTPTNTPTPYPTPTPRDWPPPYFGTPGPAQITPVPLPAPVVHNPEDFNLLLLGSDRRVTTFATDVMLLVNFQPKYDIITLLSIPRDYLAYIPGWQMGRINGAFQHGDFGYYPGLGPALVKDTLLYNLGIEVDRFMLVDFNGFVGIIDTLGGLDVPVACNYTDWRLKSPDLEPNKEINWHKYTVKAGLVHMDGDLALWYARSRLMSSGFDRSRRQQELIRALYSHGLRLNMLGQIPTLFQQFSSSVITDFTMIDALTLSPQIKNLNSAHIRSYYIGPDVLTRWRTPGGNDVMVPHQAEVYALVAEALGPPKDDDLAHTAIMVVVWNGTTVPDMDLLAAERLHYAGFTPQIAQANATTHTQTVLYDLTNGQQSDAAQYLLSLFELAQLSDLVTAPDTSDISASFLLILGNDFDPCFDPTDIER